MVGLFKDFGDHQHTGLPLNRDTSGMATQRVSQGSVTGGFPMKPVGGVHPGYTVQQPHPRLPKDLRIAVVVVGVGQGCQEISRDEWIMVLDIQALLQ